MDFRIELVPLPVTDVDRAVAFYGDTVGWNVDFDQTVHEGLRFVQVTPPGSAQMIQVVVEDADAALAYLKERGVEADGVDEQPWGRFVRFEDPDGNRWALQQIVRPT